MEKDKHTAVYWYGYLELDQRSNGQLYVFGLLFFINIATTTGYPEMIIYNQQERAMFIFFIWVGDALFALAFGMIALTVKTLPEKYENVFERIRYENFLKRFLITKFNLCFEDDIYYVEYTNIPSN